MPLFRQRFDPDKWQEDGFTSYEESEHWSNKSCGIACVQMAISYFCNEKTPSLSKLLHQGLAIAGYCPLGWIHSKLVELLLFYNLHGETVGIDSDIEFITSAVKSGKLVITSITEKFPCDGRKGGHLVVVTGYSQNRIFFNDPSAWGQDNFSVSYERFLCSFSGRVILVSPSPAG